MTVPRNLREKISNLLDDIQTLPRYEALRRIEQLVNEELSFMEAEHSVDEWDLTKIKSDAINEFNNTTMSTSLRGTVPPEHLADWCRVLALIGFLRSKGLIKFTLAFKNKIRKYD